MDFSAHIREPIVPQNIPPSGESAKNIFADENYLKEQEFDTLSWPSQSLDLNPIENLWSILDKSLKYRSPSNENELFEIQNCI